MEIDLNTETILGQVSVTAITHPNEVFDFVVIHRQSG